MNDEIKEILNKLKDDGWYDELDLTGEKWIELRQRETNQLLDYITNLQQAIKDTKDTADDMLYELKQENERLKDELETMTFTSKVKQEAVDSLISRIDKAVEYFKYQLENLDFYEDIKARMLCAMGITLLQNGIKMED